MLDQNTDRMWYVIGAVIVGAALILIMNTTMPNLFASVGETFKDKTEEVQGIINDIDPNTATDGVAPVTPNPNLIPDPADFKRLFTYDGAKYTYETGVSVPEWNTHQAARFKTTGGTTVVKLVRSIDSSLWKGKMATLSVYVKNMGTTDAVVFSNGVGSKYVKVNAGETTRVVVSGRVRSDYNFVQFRYDAATPDSDIDLILYGHKIELGDKATPYIE